MWRDVFRSNGLKLVFGRNQESLRAIQHVLNTKNFWILLRFYMDRKYLFANALFFGEMTIINKLVERLFVW